MLPHFQCDNFHFRYIEGRSADVSNLKDKTLLENIWRALLHAFWRQDPGIIRGNMLMLGNMTGVTIGDLGLEEWMPPLVPYPLTDEFGI